MPVRHLMSRSIYMTHAEAMVIAEAIAKLPELGLR
jgi:hypothetical protein